MNKIEFEIAIQKANTEFKGRLEQQRLFQIQNTVLRKLQEKLTLSELLSEDIRELSIRYEDFRKKLDDTGRTYTHIVNEKSLVDIYGSFEQFLSDCMYCIYFYFPMFLNDKNNNTVNVYTSDLFIAGQVDLCKRNVVESKVKSTIQAKNIKDILKFFAEKFKVEKMENILNVIRMDKLFEIALIRNLIVHNHGIVNLVYIEQIKNVKKITFTFQEGDSILEKLSDIVDEAKEITVSLCEEITKTLINNSHHLSKYHDGMI